MTKVSFSTSSENIAAKGKGKVKIPMESPEAAQLLADCGLSPTQVQRLDNGTPLINAWKTIIAGNEITFCHSIKTNDNKIHIRDLSGNVTILAGGRDAFIDTLLRNCHSESTADGVSGAGANSEVASEQFLPNQEDLEAAYGMLAVQGQQISVDALLKQVELNLSGQGVVLDPEWKAKTKANLALWST